MKNRSIFSAMLFLSVIYFSCRKENDNSPQNSSQSKIQAAIAGVVLDESNAPVPGVTVKTAEGQTVSDQNGIFIFSNISVDRKRCLVTYEKPGYFTGSKAFIPSQDNLNYTRIILLSKGAGEVISAPAGGKVNLANTASVEFQSSSFVDQNGSSYNGSVTVHMKHLSPDDQDFGSSFPGGDLAARDQSGNGVVLYSYGMLGVELKGSGGTPLQLASGKKATLTFPIADSQLATAPASIPLWYYDENELMWKQEGVASKVGKEYVGTVSHFSWWNVDVPSSMATIEGTVVDNQNNPIPNVIVTVNTNNTTVTDQAGHYSGMVPSGIPLSFQVLATSNSGLISPVVNISALSSGQSKVVPDLITQTPARITGNLTGCNSEPINGTVAVYIQNQLLNYTLSASGVFDIIVPANSTITLVSTGNSISQSNTVLSPNSGVITSAGTIQLCGNNVPTDNSFILNGDGYNNELIAIDSLMMSKASYHTSTQNTGCSNVGTGFSGPLYLDLYFPGNSTGTYTLPGTPGYVDAYIVIINHNKQFQGSNSGNNNQLTITVTEYGAVGGKVKGTFSGSLSRWDGNNWVYVNISNGKFSYTRGPDLL